MPDYKLYRLDRAGRISGVPETFTAADDDAAIAQAEERRRGAAAELWQGRRFLKGFPGA